MKQDNTLQVYYDERLVGTLAMTANRKAASQGDRRSFQPEICYQICSRP